MSSWHDEAKAMFIKNASYEEIGSKFGRHSSTIYKLSKEQNWVRPTKARTGGRKSFADSEVLSTVHRSVGIRLGMHRVMEQENFSQMGDRLGCSRLAASNMEKGFYDFSLTELNKIADLLGTDLIELLTPLHSGGVSSPPRAARPSV
ncbi:hypothetical protein IZ6_24520 [Terrihabitans soli]|uniref:HTH cro/C1-type domain-containing protein n=1 Tax=Terrihabitans soli TaxID=708113 RepID=A0A6S6QUX3_9HYPH|nr:helix-turn-helix transcriptional regulator [Terrihabitans soli]BCJ91717.1 hypothetical protein IZ6_24520 [Terrihabitans soli]